MSNDNEPPLLVRNSNLKLLKSKDILNHLGLEKKEGLKKRYGDVEFVCVCGTTERARNFANFIMKEIDYKLPTGSRIADISGHTNRYSMFKVGPILSVSHGMGQPSIAIVLNELFKLMFYAECKNPIFFRLGTCSGIGLDYGHVVITDKVVDGYMKSSYETVILGKKILRPAILDEELKEKLYFLHPEDTTTHRVILGNTMCINDYYEGGARMDGAFCEFNETDRLNYLTYLENENVICFDMESLAFAALTHHAGIKAAVVCISIGNRLKNDQTTSTEIIGEWQDRAMALVARYIKKNLKNWSGRHSKTSNVSSLAKSNEGLL